MWMFVQFGIMCLFVVSIFFVFWISRFGLMVVILLFLMVTLFMNLCFADLLVQFRYSSFRIAVRSLSILQFLLMQVFGFVRFGLLFVELSWFVFVNAFVFC